MNKSIIRPYELHISRQSRDLYQFDETLFTLSGNIIFANFHAVRLFAQKINSRRDLVAHPEQGVRAGQINTLGLIDEILHLLVAQYRQQTNPAHLEQALEWLEQHLGKRVVADTLYQFTDEFPPLRVYRGEQTVAEYLVDTTNGIPNRQIALEEMLLLWVTNLNPAATPYKELFNDQSLQKDTSYLALMEELTEFYKNQPTIGSNHQTLIAVLRAPALAAPYSLSDQLEFIRQNWDTILVEVSQYFYRMLSSLDMIQEEEKAFHAGLGGPMGGPAPAQVVEFRGQELEPEQFSPDRDWMPSLVLIAKNAYVWLDQLSKRYQRPINHLDEIPDEELDTLARWGITGLWLIGLWERSSASKRIKQLRGKHDAVASAYSLFDYQIADDLGGESAYQNLRDRTWQRGIRLASDMVPNHMGIDSRWVVEHPNWFVQLDYSPFPSYTYNGPNLSWDERVGIYLEDHYYNDSDAAVVFKRVDHWTGATRYIYHGNDGTLMPWNDTAQLNFLNPEVREAVIQTILHVARKFHVIRFDAAMTLAKKHVQRLWFPEPGTGGAIPTRAEFGMTHAQFEAAIPNEFWREVVDRVAQEVPDTLLLAEAFWMMEGYFVRTLGMHRVYNSAFMNMLRDEKNQEYRLVIKNTLEFDPEILKRYVNFMNNPDERTAVDQFGKGDKYFGICLMMVTLPGLPMIGHGQIEGFTERYGMEFRHAYWEETADNYLVERHTREIFPLLRKRYIFAEVEHFLLFDFRVSEGQVNEDVFAYSNRSDQEYSLVIYHNKYASISGWIHTSAAYSVKTGQGEERTLVQRTLGEGLSLVNDPNYFSIFRDAITGLEYIRRNRDLINKGLYIELGAYQYHVFLGFRQVQDNPAHQYAQLETYLEGRGVTSITEAMQEMVMQPILAPYRDLVNGNTIRELISHRLLSEPAQETVDDSSLQSILDHVEDDCYSFLLAAETFVSGAEDAPLAATIAHQIRQELAVLLNLPRWLTNPKEPSAKNRELVEYLIAGPKPALLTDESETPALTPIVTGDPAIWGVLLSWLLTRRVGQIVNQSNYLAQSRIWLDEWLLSKTIAKAMQELGLDAGAAQRCVSMVKLLISHSEWWQVKSPKEPVALLVLQSWLRDEEIRRFCGVNRFQDVLWYNKESFEELLWWLYTAAAIEQRLEVGMTELTLNVERLTFNVLRKVHQLILELKQAEEQSEYQIEKLLAAAEQTPGTASGHDKSNDDLLPV